MSAIKRIFQWLLAVLLSLFVYSSAFAIDPIHSNLFGSAIDGYDPVAYFKDSKAVEGENKYSYEWNGAKWYFKMKRIKQTSLQHLKNMRRNTVVTVLGL